MAFTGSWIWETPDKDIDLYDGFGAKRSRENWTMVRKRMTDVDHASEQGDTATTLTAKLGTVEKVYTAPTLTDLIAWTSISSANWCTSSQVWIPSGQISNGGIVYVPRGINIPNENAVNALIRVKVVDSISSTDGQKVSYIWRVCEVSPNDLSDLAEVETIQATLAGYSWSAVSTSGTLTVNRYPYSNFAGVASEAYSPVGLVLGDGSDLNGSFSGSATATTTSAQMEFTCISDKVGPDVQGATWWTQTQTWVYKSPWS